MVRGRVFTASDRPGAEAVAIVNETFGERYLGLEADALGTTLVSGDGWSTTVVGIVHDVVERGVESPAEPALYLPIDQDIRVRSLVLRTIGDPREHVRAVESAVWEVDPDLPIYEVETMETLVDRRIGGFAVIGYLMGAFALLSLLLGAVGIYGVTAYATGQRTSEIGVRLAMGAERNDVVRMVVRDGALRTVIGLALGLALALLLGGAMGGILIGVSPRDPVIFGGVVLTLVAVSLLGLYLPAKRASGVDPVRALTAD
jgi:putative ABC transport system permease protein